MKITVSTFLFLVVLRALVVGCGSGEPRKATDGASPDAIAEYEAAVAAAEGNMDADLKSAAAGE